MWQNADAADRALETIQDAISKRGLSMAALLRKLDVNNDRKISLSELKRGLDNLNTDLTSKEIADFIRLFDDNRDGALDYDEFVRHFSANRMKATHMQLP
jgi:Ca2+-binding EF-hand superfamily protein